MNRRHLEPLLLTLESTPALIARAAEKIMPSQARQKPVGGGFSFVEHAWHLADLELEGFAVRIERILGENEPFLSDFNGERIAAERGYGALDYEDALFLFADARATNVERLRSLTNGQWRRFGRQESIGVVTLEDIPRMMADHDRAHTAEIAALLAHIKEGKPFSAQSVSAVA